MVRWSRGCICSRSKWRDTSLCLTDDERQCYPCNIIYGVLTLWRVRGEFSFYVIVLARFCWSWWWAILLHTIWRVAIMSISDAWSISGFLWDSMLRSCWPPLRHSTEMIDTPISYGILPELVEIRGHCSASLLPDDSLLSCTTLMSEQGQL